MKINLTLEKMGSAYRVSICDDVYYYAGSKEGILRVVVSVLGREIFERTFKSATDNSKDIEELREAFITAVEEVRDT